MCFYVAVSLSSSCHFNILFKFLPFSVTPSFSVWQDNGHETLKIEISYQARFCLQTSYPVLLFTMLIINGICKLWEFHHSHPSAGNKHSTRIVIVPAGRMRLRCSARHMTLYSSHLCRPNRCAHGIMSLTCVPCAQWNNSHGLILSMSSYTLVYSVTSVLNLWAGS